MTEAGQLRQLTRNQIHALAPGALVYARLVVENSSKGEIIPFVHKRDRLIIEKKERPGKRPLIMHIRPASFGIDIDLRESRSTKEGFFYSDPGWSLSIFSKDGQGDMLEQVEQVHQQAFNEAFIEHLVWSLEGFSRREQKEVWAELREQYGERLPEKPPRYKKRDVEV